MTTFSANTIEIYVWSAPDKAIDIIDEAGARTHTVDSGVEELRVLKNKITSYKQKKENLIKGQQFEEACK